jgi:hypothetical protein
MKLILTIIILLLWPSLAYAPGSTNPIVDDPHPVGGVLRDAPQGYKMLKAMSKMGINYDYEIYWERGPLLKVSVDGGKTWRRLRYENVSD